MKSNLKTKHISNVAMSPIDKEINRLFLINPKMDFDVCMQTLGNLGNLNANEKRGWLVKLRELREEFITDTFDYENETLELLMDHISKWEKHIATLGLDDISEIIEETPFTLVDVAFEKLSPQSIADLLEGYLIGQHEYAQKLALSFYLHIMRNKNSGIVIPKSNLLAFGPSGAGKTFGPQILSKLFGFKLGVVNCNSIVQEGIRGQHITDVFDEIFVDAEEEMGKLENAVILLDEFDKLFDSGEFNERILNEVLNVIDDDNSVTFSHGLTETMRVSTKNMLFIFSGVFRGIESVVKKRVGYGAIGFAKAANAQTEFNYHNLACEEDFANFFKRDELSGRILQYAHVNNMTEDVMTNILLKSKDSPLVYFTNYFKAKNIRLFLTEDGAKAIAAVANKRKLGVRGLKSTMFNVLYQDMFSLDKNEVVVDRDMVKKKIA